MQSPSSFCTISTSFTMYELKVLLISLSIYHTNSNIYIISDIITKKCIENMKIKPKLNIKWYIELDEYSNVNREEMTKTCTFGKFLLNKPKVISYALSDFPDTLFLDSDVILLDKITTDTSYDIGLSPHYIQEGALHKSGYYNAGMI